MSRPAVVKFDANAPRDDYFLPPEKRLAGNPKQSVWVQYTDPSGRFMTGIWHSEVGRWKVAYTEEEYCHIMAGVSVLTDTAGKALTVKAGEDFVVPRGFVGTWEVVEPTTKRFVVYDTGEPLEE
ncbi:MAG TPA: cupin domain-containing protein [Steroidobacteraceae bacterium]|nr:cupin domain-containing protein [Steroidobacteraceae bacterium]